MRTPLAVLLCVMLSPAVISNPERPGIPTVAADALTIREVRRGSEIDGLTELGDLRDLLFVERPVDAREGTTSSVFVLNADGVLLQRVQVWYGRAVTPLLQIERGVSVGARVVVSDMRAWDQFDRLQLRSR